MAGDASLLHPGSPGTNSCSNCGSINLSTSDVCSFCGHALPRHQATATPGDHIAGKYEVLSLLGVGGMGEVFKVRHVNLDDVRCIKLMRSDVMDDEQFRARFLREARIATRIHHPNVAVIHDFDATDSGQHFLVSEYIDGITVRQWSRRHGRYPVELAIHLTLQILSGLRHIHSRGLLHRDISGDNVMITLDHDERPLAKIIDLGIAKLVGGISDVTHATQVGAFVGNPKYSSPEQLGMIDDDESLDARSDLYSLGVVLYEMLTGQPPFSSRSPQGYLAKHLTQKPPSLNDSAPDAEFPDELEAAILKALAKNRDDRWESARAFSVALRPFDKTTPDSLAEYGEQLILDLPSRQANRLRESQAEEPVTDETVPRRRASPDTVEVRTEVDPDAIEDEAWRNALEENTRFSFEQYLLLFPEGSHSREAQKRVHELVDLEIIGVLVSEDDSDGLAEVAGDRQRSPAVRAAADEALRRIRRSRDEVSAGWKIASAIATEAEIERFLRDHPEFERAGDARDLLEQVRARNAFVASKRAADAEAYLERWPTGRFAAEARDLTVSKKERARFDAAIRDRSTGGFRALLRDFPNGAYREEAMRYLQESLAWDQMGWIKRDLEHFLQLFPDGLHASEAKQRLREVKARSET